MNNRAISMIALVITIIVIIIIASITAPLLSNVISDSLLEDAKVELRNVETVVGYAKTLILNDEFSPNPAYIISNEDLKSKFGTVLTYEEMEKIKEINENSKIKAPYKYYLMDEKSFRDEFGNGFNVSGIREAKYYLVNYMNDIVVGNFGGKRLTNENEGSIIPSEDVIRGKVFVEFVPNGNSEWSKQQDTEVFITGNNTVLGEQKYVWTQSIAKPNDSEFTSDISDRQTVGLNGKTGNNWYLWIKVNYTDDGENRTEYFKSEPFFVDNEPPTFTMEVDEITK